LKLKSGKQLSSFAFNFDLRRYTEVAAYVTAWRHISAACRLTADEEQELLESLPQDVIKVGRCRLALSNPSSNILELSA
jgi:hypothetical protein